MAGAKSREIVFENSGPWDCFQVRYRVEGIIDKVERLVKRSKYFRVCSCHIRSLHHLHHVVSGKFARCATSMYTLNSELPN